MKRWLPAVTAVVIFVVLLVVFFIAIGASKPSQVAVLSAARNLKPGDVITAADLQTVRIYNDPRAADYIPANRKKDVIGGVVLEPVPRGAPIPAIAVAAVGTADHRLAGLLAKFPDRALFPLPLDLQNVIAPDADTFHAGDVVSITVVYTDRPQMPPENNPEAEYSKFLFAPGQGGAYPTPAPTEQATPSPMDYTERGKPPVAKVISGQGYRVVAVLGLPEPPPLEGDNNNPDVYTANIQQPHPFLLLLVPQRDLEPLSLALSQGRVFVSIILRSKYTEDGGYSYWDFEQMLKEERERLQKAQEAPNEMIEGQKSKVTPTPTPTPTPHK